MWLRLLLLLVYVAVLLFLARLLEAVSWIESGHFSRRLLDPMTLSVLKLKALLEQRGVSYETAVEKQDLKNLMEATGAVTEEEVEESSTVEPSTVTNFSTGSNFLEQVEDSKDSVWLVKVNSDQHPFNYLVDTSWNTIKQKMNRFGVRIGNFDCVQDRWFCSKKKWTSSRLILSLPLYFRIKSEDYQHNYQGTYKTQNIYNWVKETLSRKVYMIENQTHFQDEWLSYKESDKDSEVRMVMFSESDLMPLFYSSLSLKFPGRVKFGFAKREFIKGSFNDMDFEKKVANWTYIVITQERTFLYGSRPSESVTYRSMDIFLRSLYPSVNDIFISSLIICNCLTLFELSFVQGSILKRVIKFVWCAVKFNMALLLLWMLLLTVFQLSCLSGLVEYGLKVIRTIGGSDFFSMLKTDYHFYSYHPFLVEMLFLFYLILIGFHYRKKHDSTDSTDAENSPDWDFAQFRTLEHLFYPVQPRSLLNRNAMAEWHHQEIPSLWAAVHMSTDYVHTLPVWEFRETFRSESDNEDNPEIESLKDENIKELEPQEPTLIPESGSDVNSTNESEVETENTPNKSEIRSVTGKADGREQSHTGPSCPAGYLQGSQCVICLDNYVRGIMLCGLPCGHCFHRKCIIVWLMRDNHFCPVCRWPSNKPKIEMHLHSE
ncbi:hypothetical protein FSP39_016010 [Pinctada imbricata]|uniref:RING-type domain-containing protein n=1 Tax=Pinctada imbricata TaxID=66713 RepID=A0AA89BTS2_PINIB|nr:hypothetical protein FSP39_016010 [Pinctada imbricata]